MQMIGLAINHNHEFIIGLFVVQVRLFFFFFFFLLWLLSNIMNHPGSADLMAAHAVPYSHPHRRYHRYSRYLRYPRLLPLPTVDAPPSYSVVARGILGISELAHLISLISLV